MLCYLILTKLLINRAVAVVTSMNLGKDGSIKMQISFDEANRIRILEADMFKQTENLAGESTGFVESNVASCSS